MVSFDGTEHVKASPEKVWAFLMDTKRFTACAPAMQNVKIKSDREFSFDLEAAGRKIPFTARWRDLTEPSQARLQMEGGGRLTGGAKMDNRFKIAAGSDNGSSVEWSTDVDVFGAARMFISDREIEKMVTGMNAGVIACMRREIEGR